MKFFLGISSTDFWVSLLLCVSGNMFLAQAGAPVGASLFGKQSDGDPAAQVRTLREALAGAYARNPDLASLRAQVGQDKESIVAAQVDGFPQLSFSVEHDQHLLGEKASKLQHLHNSQAGFSLTQSLFVGGEDCSENRTGD